MLLVASKLLLGLWWIPNYIVQSTYIDNRINFIDNGINFCVLVLCDMNDMSFFSVVEADTKVDMEVGPLPSFLYCSRSTMQCIQCRLLSSALDQC
jgi:hypothetical protein